MRTEVSKSFKWGFLLSEQELRRIIQACHEHFAKITSIDQAKRRLQVTARLDDGSIIESDNADDILALENRGSKTINHLTISADDGSGAPQWIIEVQVSDAGKSSESWTSIALKVVGLSRDWAFLAASEVEERLRNIRLFSWTYLTQSRWFTLLPAVLGSLAFLLLVSYFRAEDVQHALARLEEQHRAGLLRDPVDAILKIEQAKIREEAASKTVPMLLIAFGLPTLVAAAIAKIAPWLFPSYNFHWGDQVEKYKKKKQRANTVWTVIVLGFLVSLAAIAIDRYFFK